MSTPTEAQVQTQISNAVALFEHYRKYLTDNAQNYVADEDTLVQSLIGDWSDQVAEGVFSVRGSLADILARETAILEPLFRTYAKVADFPETEDVQKIWDYLYNWFIDNNLRVKTRGFTFGAVTASGTPSGTGRIIRVTKDAHGFDIETAHAETKRLEVVRDENSGTDPGREEFEVRGGSAGRDIIGRSKSDRLIGTLVALTADDSLLLNSGFRSFAGTASAPTDIVGWTSSVAVNGLNYEFDSTNFFRKIPSDGNTSYALRMKATANLTQKLTVPGVDLSTDRPYFLAVYFNSQVYAATGTLTARMGAVNNSVSVGALTGWNLLLVPGTAGQSNWYRNFKEPDLDIALEWSATGGTGLLIGEVIFAPMTLLDSTFWAAIPDSAPSHVNWVLGDQYSVTDSILSDSVLQRHFAERLGRYLPHATGTPVTWGDPP